MRSETDHHEKVGSVLVVGGGVGGMQAALDLAESGFKVYLLEKEPSIGGTMAKLDKTFPTNDCAMCTLAPRLVDTGKHLNIERLTYSELLELSGTPGRFKVLVKKKARSVDPDKCTGCSECMEACLVRNRPYSPGVEPELQDVEGQELLVLREILGRYPRGREAIVPILQDITAEFNWLPEWSLRMVAHTLGLPLSRVVRVATFYNLFSLEPRGKHIIRVCTGTACHVKGAGKIVDSLERELKVKSGETTDDRRFTLEAVRCLGCCGLAPVVTIDEEVYGKITSARLVKELDAYPA